MCCKINQPPPLDSSETTCKAPFYKKSNFDFSLYFQTFQPQHIKTQNAKFLEWFIGFTEGDDCFQIFSNRCSFIINQKDIALLHKIRTLLGFGEVMIYIQKGQKYGRYSVQSQKGCLRLAILFNGNLVLEKTNLRFHKWVKFMKTSPHFHVSYPTDKQIQIQSHNIAEVGLNNSWLSGFIDAEGCFYARIRKRSRMKTGLQLIRKFSLNQKGELDTLTKINLVLKNTGRVQTITNLKNLDSIYYKIEIHRIESTQILLDYLDNYPCLGQKRLLIQIYRQLNNSVKRKEHLTKDGLKKIQRFCNRCKKLNNVYFCPLLLPEVCEFTNKLRSYSKARVGRCSRRIIQNQP
uniref:Putative site-specific DNA endonuclease n=1 Tax=Tupiella akineta TaxID=160070 RepID=Q3ZIZ2_TUPAK|nr:putative site-specific DNA endonuclease [Tupiella akineta]AAV80697.1 putative site-specific DNA endonuclease [Tupiella akineta]